MKGDPADNRVENAGQCCLHITEMFRLQIWRQRNTGQKSMHPDETSIPLRRNLWQSKQE